MNKLIKSALIVFLIFSPVLLFSQNKALQYYQNGLKQYNKENYYQALAELKNSLSENPSYFDSVLKTSQCYFFLGEYEQASIFISKALLLNSLSIEATNTEGRIFIGLGQLNEASKRFESVLKKEPNNTDALFGQAEIAVAKGNKDLALNLFKKGYSVSPENRRALLSLVLISDETGNSTAAAVYLEQALKLYSSEPVVQYMAAKHYFALGQTSKATAYLETALDLNPQYINALLLASRAAYESAAYQKASDYATQAVTLSKLSVSAWYMMGLSQARLGSLNGAVNGFLNAEKLDAQEEIPRMALEKFLSSLTSEEDVLRSKYSIYHYNLGVLYEKNLQWERAFLEYRRALQVYPYSVEARKALAALYDKLGYKEKSLEAFSVLSDLGLADQKVKDEIETRKRALLDSISGRWSLPIYPGGKKAYRISVFYQKEPVSSDFPEISSVLADQFYGLMQKYSRTKMNLIKNTYSENDAFVTSRTQGDDYFIIIDADPGLRQISVRIRLYSARTGSLLSSFSKYRTGNERIIQALIAASTQTVDLLPQRAILSARQFSKGVIDLGSFDQVAKDDIFLIIRAGSLALKPDKTGFSYSAEEVLGEFTVTKVEETYSEGTVTKTTFFDQINTGDWIIRKTDKAVSALSSTEISLPSAFLELK